MLSEIQKFLNKRKLRRQTKPLKRQALSLSDSKWVGILFDATSIEHIEATQKYAEELRGAGKQVRLLAYVDDKSKDIALPFPHFSKADVNVLNVPKGQVVENFVTTTFDILFVLHPKTTTLFEYISTMVDARLKVGPFSRSKETFDFMVDVNSRSALHYFINQVEFFIGKLQPKPIHEAKMVEKKRKVAQEELVAA